MNESKKLLDVTGKHPEVPVCPQHNVALLHETRDREGGKKAGGFMRCPICHHVYLFEKPLAPIS